ncbi:aspartyl-phosphate phosphatase Spo0E family protein [Alkalihalophilus pseudofirmus]|uniref:Aspartyl-phosphate phosphatase Spo0E family protein n=1 Tax=Alkalihalophilus pseudofirmus TaxID=79885 RepID=A0AAJ2NPV8_ALKPS|nr:aspartyl-phosphate phosphatase Spo0E family protein [Alkalihalophilus pseudofirmus]MDV2886344.1 aspartyl-phosphate phosphatase Spo0E family protein [Alkalihalophilus pseudofirmus]
MFEESQLCLCELKLKIEAVRQAMVHSGLVNGLNHPKTLEYSQELDRLLNTLASTT